MGGGGGLNSTTTTGGLQGGDDPARTAALLIGAGIAADAAERIGRTYPYRHVERHLARWQEDRSADDPPGEGALLHRIKNWPTPQPQQERRTGLEPFDVPAGYEGIVKH